jgi:hypothetical protein
MAWGLRNFTMNTTIYNFTYIALGINCCSSSDTKRIADINRGEDVEGDLWLILCRIWEQQRSDHKKHCFAPHKMTK